MFVFFSLSVWFPDRHTCEPFTSHRLFKPRGSSCHDSPAFTPSPKQSCSCSPAHVLPHLHTCATTHPPASTVLMLSISQRQPVPLPSTWKSQELLNQGHKGQNAATPGPAGSKPRLAAAAVLAVMRLGEDGSWEKSKRGLAGHCPNNKNTRKKQSLIPDHSEVLKIGEIQKQPHKNFALSNKSCFAQLEPGCFIFQVH